MEHRIITPNEGARIIASQLVNHDTVPDILSMTAQAAAEQGESRSTSVTAAILRSMGYVIDDNGWIVDHPDWHDQ